MNKVLAEKLPKHWATGGINPDKYEVATDNSFHGEQALVVQSKADALIEVLSGGGADNVLVFQTFGAASYLGKRLKFSAFLKTEKVVAGAGLRLTVMDVNRLELTEDTMYNRLLQGDRDWTACQCVLDVPPGARFINIGGQLIGSGKLWLAGLEVETVAEEVATTDQYAADFWSHLLAEAPINLDFAEAKEGAGKGALIPSAWTEGIAGMHLKKADFGVFLEQAGLADETQVLSLKVLVAHEYEEISLHQRFSAHKYRGKKVKCGFCIATELVEEKAYGCLSVYGCRQHQYACCIDAQSVLDGTNDFRSVELVLVVHPLAKVIQISFYLKGTGVVKISHVTFEEVADDVPETVSGADVATNLDFAL